MLGSLLRRVTFFNHSYSVGGIVYDFWYDLLIRLTYFPYSRGNFYLLWMVEVSLIYYTFFRIKISMMFSFMRENDFFFFFFSAVNAPYTRMSSTVENASKCPNSAMPNTAQLIWRTCAGLWKHFASNYNPFCNCIHHYYWRHIEEYRNLGAVSFSLCLFLYIQLGI